MTTSESSGERAGTFRSDEYEETDTGGEIVALGRRRLRADSVRYRRRAEDRLRVEKVALELFQERGFDQVTVPDICAAAGIAPATFYRYFGTKEEVMFAYREAFAEALRAAVDDTAWTGSRCGQIRAVLLAFARYIDANRDVLGVRDGISAANRTLMRRTLEVQREWEAQLREGLVRARGLAAPDLPAHLDAAEALAVLRVAWYAWRGYGRASLPAALQEMFDAGVLGSDAAL